MHLLIGKRRHVRLPRYACRHNLVYWRNLPYLGFGPGAHSSYAGKRWSIIRNVEDYIRGVTDGTSLVAYEERIPRDLEMAESMMLGLRLLEVGVERAAFRQRFGLDIAEVFGRELEQLVERGLLELNEHHTRLTPAARLLGNEVFAAFLPDQS